MAWDKDAICQLPPPGEIKWCRVKQLSGDRVYEEVNKRVREVCNRPDAVRKQVKARGWKRGGEDA